MNVTPSQARRLGVLPKKQTTPAQKQVAKMKREQYEDALARQLPVFLRFERQFKFLPDRAFRADFAFPDARLLVEVDGGMWIRGSKSHGAGGYELDRERDALAMMAGWVVLRVTPGQVKDGRAADWVVAVHRVLTPALPFGLVCVPPPPTPLPSDAWPVKATPRGVK